MKSTMNRPVEQITIAPLVQLVGIDGFAVPDCERHTPVPDREPCPADSWPAWTDLVSVGLGGRDYEHHVGGAKLADAYRSTMERYDGEPDMPDEGGEPFEEPDGDRDAVDADPAIAFPGIEPLAARRLAPISGGSPEYTDDDLADHLMWLEECYPDRATAFAPGEIG